MTKYAIDLGHGVQFDGGAVGLRKEEDLINETGELLIAKLKDLGHEVVEVRPSTASSTVNSLKRRCDEANETNCDVFVSLHANKFNGKAFGSEIFAISTAGRKIAAAVLQEICDLGFVNRGVKHKRFYVLRHTVMPAILVEMCFCDSKRDIALFDAEKMADAIVKGLTGRTAPQECKCD